MANETVRVVDTDSGTVLDLQPAIAEMLLVNERFQRPEEAAQPVAVPPPDGAGGVHSVPAPGELPPPAGAEALATET